MMSVIESGESAGPAMLTVAQAAEELGVGRTMAYTLIRTGAWPTPVIRLGRLIKIPAEPLHRLVSTGSTAPQSTVA